MAVTKEDIREFNRFVEKKLANGGAKSLAALVSEWESLRGKSGHELDEQTTRAFSTAFPEGQDEFELQQALARRGGITTAELLSKAAIAAK